MSAKTNFTYDDHDDYDDGFVDIDEFLTGLQQKNTLANAQSDVGGITVDDRTRGSSSTVSSRSTVGSTQDPIILSDDEPASVNLETDLCSSDVDLTGQRDSSSQPTTPDAELEACDINLEIISSQETKSSKDEDHSDTASTRISERSCSRMRIKDTTKDCVAGLSTHSLDASYQAATAASPCTVHESEEIPIHGYFTLKTSESNVLYCLTFSQELVPFRGQRHRQDNTSDLKEPQLDIQFTEYNPDWDIRKIIGRKMVGCERHYRVQWEDTWMPESELAKAKELIAAFENDGNRTEGTKRSLKRGRSTARSFDARDGQEPKKRRGRPPKQ